MSIDAQHAKAAFGDGTAGPDGEVWVAHTGALPPTAPLPHCPTALQQLLSGSLARERPQALV